MQCVFSGLQELAQQHWPAVPARSKDYIAQPKANGYQSLHSTLSMQHMQQHNRSSGGSGNGVMLSYLELQIRTAAMHAAAEGGDAAHAGYKGRLGKRQVCAAAKSREVMRGAADAAHNMLLTSMCEPMSAHG